MTWRVQYWRNDSPYPASHYHRGLEAEAGAHKKAEELAQRAEVRRVEVERIERRAKGRPVFSGGIEP